MSPAGQRWNLARYFGSAVFGQALLSAANFLAGLLLIRNVADRDYGYYVLATTTLLLFAGLQGAFISGPLAVLAPQRDEAARRDLMGALYAGLRPFWLAAGLAPALLMLLAWAVGWLSSVLLWVGLAFIAAASFSLQRDFLRQCMLLYARPLELLKSDALYVFLLLGGVAAAAWFAGAGAAAGAVAAIGLAALLSNLGIRASLARDPGWVRGDVRAALRQVAPLGAWAAAGSLIYWSFSQGFYYLMAARIEVAAIASVAAARLLLMPVNLLGAGLSPLLLPTAARWLREAGFDPMLRRLLAFAGATAALSLSYVAVLWLLRDWLVLTLMKKTLADLDALILLWAAIFCLSVVRSLLMTALLVCERFQRLTWLALACAVVSLSLSLWGIEQAGARGALLGIVVGEVMNFVGVLLLVWLERRRRA